jgi:hypothetical protein
VVAELNAARDAEYADVLERLPEFHAELDKERARGRATYAEVEECEADLDRFRSWLGKITAGLFRRPGRRSGTGSGRGGCRGPGRVLAGSAQRGGTAGNRLAATSVVPHGGLRVAGQS